MQAAFLVFPGITPLDLFGPLDVLSRVKDLNVQLVSCDSAPIQLDNNVIINPQVTLNAESSFEVIIVPGGIGQIAFCDNEEYITLLTNVAKKARYILSICTGSLILGMCGLLKNKKAVTHWSAMDVLEQSGAIPIEKRFVEDGNIITCSGVSAGIDMALFFVKKLFGELESKKIQLSIEYNPDPPFDFKTLKEDETLKALFNAEKQSTNKKRHDQVAYFKLTKSL